jgi:hypothetical protein
MYSWKPVPYRTCFLGYKNERCFHRNRFLKANLLQNTLPGIRKWKMFPWRQILGNQHFAVESTGVSADTDMLSKGPFRSEFSHDACHPCTRMIRIMTEQSYPPLASPLSQYNTNCHKSLKIHVFMPILRTTSLPYNTFTGKHLKGDSTL